MDIRDTQTMSKEEKNQSLKEKVHIYTAEELDDMDYQTMVKALRRVETGKQANTKS